MNKKDITVYIHDLNISNKAKEILVHAGLIKLCDFLSLNTDKLSAMYGITDDVYQELSTVIAHSDEITKHFTKRAKRIAEILPIVQDTPIENLSLSTHSNNALRRSGVHSVDSLIQMSQKDIFELRNVGVLSREEITTVIENIICADEMELTLIKKENVNVNETTVTNDKINKMLAEVEDVPIECIPFTVRAKNALMRANIKTTGALVRLTDKEILQIRNIGQQTRDEIVAVINAILDQGKLFFERLKTEDSQLIDSTTEEPLIEKGFDYSVIDILTQKFGLKPVKMTEWFGLSKQHIYKILEKRFSVKKSKWTGKNLSEQEKDILSRLIADNTFDYTDGKITCCCMNNKQDDFVCLFIYENTIKCFFLRDLPNAIQEEIINKKMHIYTARELAGESSGHIVYLLTKPFYRPDNLERFRKNAQLRGMTTDEYSIFISGYPYLDQRSVTDDQIIEFMKKNMTDGKVYISSDPKNQWIRSIASRNRYSIKDFIALYGFESWLGNRAALISNKTKDQHREELKQYVIHDNMVYFPTNSKVYNLIYTYAYKYGMDMNSYIHSLGFERTTERPDLVADALEKDMEVRQSNGTFEEMIFSKYPLIGSKILKQEIIDQLNVYAKKHIDCVLREPYTKLTLQAEMQITLALINNAKNWKSEENGNFWSFILLQFGYRDTSGTVLHLLQTSLENAMKSNQRLFLEDANGRAFKSTVVIHAFSTKKSWMVLFDFLFDFYKSNLNWRVISGDPLIAVMIHALQQKLLGDSEDDSELMISSKAYSFQEGIRKLVLYRPTYTRKLFENLIEKIDSLVNSDVKPVKTYEEQLCEEWFKEKITAIVNTKKAEIRSQTIQRDVAIDYSRINVKYILKNETDVQLVFPDIRLKNENIGKATVVVSCNGTSIIRQNLSWYGNELGKTLNGIHISIPFIPYESNEMNIWVQIVCNKEIIYDSYEIMNRKVLLFYGTNEITLNQIKSGYHYTLIVPTTTKVEIENADVIEVDALKNNGLKAYFLELKSGYVIVVNGQLLAFDSETGTEIRFLAPKESAMLPSVTLRDTEAYLAYRRSSCTIILKNSDFLRRFVLLKNGKKVEFDALQHSDNGLAFTLPFNEEENLVRLQVINLADERLMFDRSFILINKADCCFNREFYFSDSDFKNAKYNVDIDNFQEVIQFTKNDTEIRIPFHEGELHQAIPKIIVEETSGAWMLETQSVWYISSIPQTSFLKVNAPEKINIRFFVEKNDIQYDGQGLVTIGNVLHSFIGTESFTDANVVMNVSGLIQKSSYTLARVFFKERFLKCPEFWFEDNKLFWDHGGAFIGNVGHQFSLTLTSPDEADYEFKLDDGTDFLLIPYEMPIGNYHYQISIQTGVLFKKVKEIIATGDCIIGDKNLLRFMGQKIVVESITDEYNEAAGHILISTCYIDQIKFCGIEDTSEGLCPVYSGILYTIGYHGERYEFSFDAYTNKKGIAKMIVNPVRIVYINDSFLCITDSEGDGLYYYKYYDYNAGTIIYALTDHEYTKENKHKYFNADLYSYRTERM